MRLIPSFILNNNESRTTDFTTKFSPSIKLNPSKEYEAALLSIDMYNSIPNVTNKNNKFKYSTDAGNTWETIIIPDGSYELDQINDKIQQQMIINDHYNKENNEFYVSIEANIPELKSVIEIKNEFYRVKVDDDISILKTLGFENNEGNETILLPGNNKSHNIVDITSINSVLVHVDIISGSYINSNESRAIYSFDPYRVRSGFKINERPNPVIYCPINTLTINSIRVWLTDQDNNPIDLRGERITVRLHLQQVRD